MYSTYNEGIQWKWKLSIVAERFIRTIKNKILKHMTAIHKNIYFHVLDDIVNKYNNTAHRTIKMKSIDDTSYSYAECIGDFNKKDPKFTVGDQVRISRYKNIFAKGYAPNWSEQVFVVSGIKITVPWTYVVSELNGEKLMEVFMKKNYKKLVKKNLEQKKYLKEKMINCMSNEKGMIAVFIVGLIKKTSYKNDSILPLAIWTFWRKY